MAKGIIKIFVAALCLYGFTNAQGELGSKLDDFSSSRVSHESLGTLILIQIITVQSRARLYPDETLNYKRMQGYCFTTITQHTAGPKYQN